MKSGEKSGLRHRGYSTKSDLIGKAYNAIERDMFSGDKEVQAKADLAFKRFQKKTMTKSELEKWAKREDEYQALR